MTVARRPIVALVVLAVLFAACGGDDDGAGGDTTTSTTAVTTTAGSSSGDNGDDGGGVDLAGAFTGQCQEAVAGVAAAMSAYSSGLAGAFTGQIDEDELQASADELRAMADGAPAELKNDLEVIANALGDFYSGLADIGIDVSGGAIPTPEQLNQLSELSESFDTEELQTATDNIDAWFEANCN
jgi:hypothetical protein